MAPVIARSAAAALADGGTPRDRQPLGSATRRFDTILQVLEMVVKDLPAADPGTRVALGRLTEALGRIFNLPPQPQEGLGAFAKRLIAHMEQMPPAARAMLDKQLIQQSLIAALKLLVESLKNGAILDLLPKGDLPLPQAGPHRAEPDHASFRPPVIQQPLPLHAAPWHPSTAAGKAPELQAALQRAYAEGMPAAGGAQGAQAAAAAPPQSRAPDMGRLPPVDADSATLEAALALGAASFDDEPIPALTQSAAFLARDSEALARVVEIVTDFLREDEESMLAHHAGGTDDHDAEFIGPRAPRASTPLDTFIGPRQAAGADHFAAVDHEPEAARLRQTSFDEERGLSEARDRPAFEPTLARRLPTAAASGVHTAAPLPMTAASPRDAAAPASESVASDRQKRAGPVAEEALTEAAPRLAPLHLNSLPPTATPVAEPQFDEWDMLFTMLAGSREVPEPRAEEGGLPPAAEEEEAAQPNAGSAKSAASHAGGAGQNAAGTAQADRGLQAARTAQDHLGLAAPAAEALPTPIADLPALALPRALPAFFVPLYPPAFDPAPREDEAEPERQKGGQEEAEEKEGQRRRPAHRGEDAGEPDIEPDAGAATLYRRLSDLS